ncbi:hypothetical protein GQ473_03070 [archaeon]|nr:hypothetical protein [archaeon]
MKQLAKIAYTKKLPETLEECENLPCTECALCNYIIEGANCQLNAMLQDFD